MKWSEQMRELLSEDEHYNQLMLDTATGMLFINDELIAVLNDIDNVGRTLEKHKFDKLIKKYPFFDDIKFLLNCIFTCENADFISYAKTINVVKYKEYYDINCFNNGESTTLRIYFKETELA